MLTGQWFRYKIFGILKVMDVDRVLVLLAIARVAKTDWDAEPHLDWGLYNSGKIMISVSPTSAPLSRVSAPASRSKILACLWEGICIMETMQVARYRSCTYVRRENDLCIQIRI